MEKFGRLKVIADAGSCNGRKLALCICECGRKVTVKYNALRTGNTKSCGCAKAEMCSIAGRKNLRHGETNGKRSSEYNLWRTMIQRCEYQKHVSYKFYGARGISVCQRWRTSFENFLADIGRRPSPKHTIERKDSNGNYEPRNCKWATQVEQQRNRRNNRMISIDGVVACVSEWLEKAVAGVSKELCNYRLKSGWEQKRAIFTPPRKGAYV